MCRGGLGQWRLSWGGRWFPLNGAISMPVTCTPESVDKMLERFVNNVVADIFYVWIYSVNSQFCGMEFSMFTFSMFAIENILID